MRVLITGYTGFVGSHLADYLVGRGDVEVFGMHRWRSRLENVQHLGDQVRLVECDLRDPAAVRRVLRDVRPDRIFHLAATAPTPGRARLTARHHQACLSPPMRSDQRRAPAWSASLLRPKRLIQRGLLPINHLNFFGGDSLLGLLPRPDNDLIH